MTDIEHATWNGAKLLGMEDRIGKVRVEIEVFKQIIDQAGVKKL